MFAFGKDEEKVTINVWHFIILINFRDTSTTHATKAFTIWTRCMKQRVCCTQGCIGSKGCWFHSRQTGCMSVSLSETLNPMLILTAAHCSRCVGWVKSRGEIWRMYERMVMKWNDDVQLVLWITLAGCSSWCCDVMALYTIVCSFIYGCLKCTTNTKKITKLKTLHKTSYQPNVI